MDQDPAGAEEYKVKVRYLSSCHPEIPDPNCPQISKTPRVLNRHVILKSPILTVPKLVKHHVYYTICIVNTVITIIIIIIIIIIIFVIVPFSWLPSSVRRVKA